MYKLVLLHLPIGLCALISSCSAGGEVTSPVSKDFLPSPPPPIQRSEQVPESKSDVVYGSGMLRTGSKTLLLDIYQSGEPCSAPRPYVVMIHGGGFIKGAKDQGKLPAFAQRIAESGYVAISINYRLEGDQPVPSGEFILFRDGLLAGAPTPITSQIQLRVDTIASAVEDAVTAVRWVEANDEANCIDSSQLALWGGSAGSFIALSVAYAIDDYLINVTKPKAVIDHWGGLFETDVMEFSDPPVFIIHGDADTVVKYDKALELQAEAEEKSVPYAFYTIADADHGFGEIPIDAFDVNGVTLQELEMQFLDAHLMDGTPNYEVVTCAQKQLNSTIARRTTTVCKPNKPNVFP